MEAFIQETEENIILYQLSDIADIVTAIQNDVLALLTNVSTGIFLLYLKTRADMPYSGHILGMIILILISD